MADAFFAGKDTNEQERKEEERLMKSMGHGHTPGKQLWGNKAQQSAAHPAPHASTAASVPVKAAPAPVPAPAPAPVPAPEPYQRTAADDEALRREELRMGAHLKLGSALAAPSAPAPAPAPASASLFNRAAHNAEAGAPVAVSAPPSHTASMPQLTDEAAADMARKEEERIRKQFGAGALPRPGERTAAAPAPPPPSDPAKPVHAPSVALPPAAAPAPAGPPATDSAFERELVAELDRARREPRAYAALVRQYEAAFADNTLRLPGTNLAVQTKEGAAPAREVAAELERLAPAQAPLRVSGAFSRSALDLVRDHGPAGRTGDQLSDGTDAAQRLVRYGTWRRRAIETIAYVPGSARDVVVLWLIDDGTADRLNRRTLLDAKYQVVGVASGPHAQFGRVVVVDWAEDFAEGAQAPAPQHAAAPEPSFAAHKVVETPKQNAVLAELPDGSGFEIDCAALGAAADLALTLKNHGTELSVARGASVYRYELPFAFTADRVTARVAPAGSLVIKLHKPRDHAGAEVELARYKLVPKSLQNRVQIEVKETHSHLLLTTLPSRWEEEVVMLLRDGKVVVWQTRHNEEDEDGLKAVTATQTLKLPFELAPGGVSVTVLPGGEGAVAQLAKPLVGAAGDVAIPIARP